MDKCKEAPRMAILAGAMACSIVGWITVLAEKPDNAEDSLWWFALGPAIQTAVLALGLIKPDNAAAALCLAMGVFLNCVPEIFSRADAASDAELDDLSFGYTMCLLGGCVAWLAIVEVPGKLEFLAKCKLHTPVVAITVLNLVGIFFLWVKAEAVDLSVWAGAATFTFFSSTILAGGALGTSEWGQRMAVFLSAFVWQKSLMIPLNDADGNGDSGYAGLTEFAAVLLFIGATAQFGFTNHALIGKDGERVDFEKAKAKPGMLVAVCAVVAFLGVILANQLTDASDQFAWGTTVAFLAVVATLVGALMDGGRQKVLYSAAAGMVFVSLITLIPQSVILDNTDALEEGTAEFGLALLEMTMLLAPILAYEPAPGDVFGKLKPAGGFPAMLAPLGFWVIFVGFVLGTIAYMDEFNYEWVGAWLTLVTAGVLAGVLDKREDCWFVVTVMAGWFFHALFATMLDSDEGLVTFSVLVYWVGVIFVCFAGFTTQKNGSSGVADAAADAAPKV